MTKGGNFMSTKIMEFLQEDSAKLDTLIEKYPVSLPTSAIADFLSLDIASVRATIEAGFLGMAWRKPGKANHGYHVPTAQFVRWYLKLMR